LKRSTDEPGNTAFFSEIYCHDIFGWVVADDSAGNVIETHEHAGDFKEWWPAETEEVSIRLHNPHRKSRHSS
jgi:hypothetical protein